MAKRRLIDTRFWSDNYISNLDPIEKLLFLYFLTNEKTSICGIYELPLKIMAIETGIEKEMIEKIINRFSADNKIYYIDSWIYIVNFVKHQILNPSVEQGIKNSLDAIPEKIKYKIEAFKTAWGQTPPSQGTDTEIPKHELELEPELKPKLKIASPSAPPSPDVEFINHFIALYAKKISKNGAVVNWGQARKLARPHLKRFGLEGLKKLLNHYFNSNEELYKENAWSLTCFLSVKTLHKLNAQYGSK